MGLAATAAWMVGIVVVAMGAVWVASGIVGKGRRR